MILSVLILPKKNYFSPIMIMGADVSHADPASKVNILFRIGDLIEISLFECLNSLFLIHIARGGLVAV